MAGRTEALLETLRDLLAAGNPGLVTRDDFTDLEDRIAELEELVDEIEECLAQNAASQGAGGAAKPCDRRRPRHR